MIKRLALAVAAAAICMSAIAQNSSGGVDAIMNAVHSTATPGPALSIVRESALREAAITIGARQGLSEKACSISKEIEARRAALDKRFRFSDLMMGAGVLPPVISEAVDSVSLDATVMRVASHVYHIDEPARVVDVPPTWRDWLLVGIPAKPCDQKPGSIAATFSAQLHPQNAQEEAFFRSEVAKAYQVGEKQGEVIIEQNLARLERSYLGMRRYFDLYARGMVSAPIIVSATDVVKRDDPNTLIVGDTLIRITVPADFVEKTQQWKPLAP